MMKHVQIALLAFLMLLPALAVSADPDSKEVGSLSTVSNARGTDLRALVRDVAVRTHKHFVMDPRAPQSIDLLGLEPKDVTYPQLLAALAVNGMAAVAGDGIVQVIPTSEIRQDVLPLVAPDNIKTLDDEWVTCVMPIKNISAPQLVPILRPMIPQAGHLAAYPDRNALVIVDRSANVRRLVEIIKILENLPKSTVESPPPKTSEKP
jgi:general secretion pathway protein D